MRVSHLFGADVDSTLDDIVRERERALQACIDDFLEARTAREFDDSPPLESFDLDGDDFEEESDTQEFLW